MQARRPRALEEGMEDVMAGGRKRVHVSLRGVMKDVSVVQQFGSGAVAGTVSTVCLQPCELWYISFYSMFVVR
jgi:hypothetical protein